ncbi:MAG: hypothetical protein PHQ77_03875 [Proteiniphilum sp.]|jgi:hypothetical protein|nr:hypothetical protein [Proteiniphilum sp.]
MGILIKFLLFFTIVYLLMKAFVGFLGGKKQKQPPRPQQRAAQPRQPETQNDRIIEYQKKNFEKSEVEDVEFVEMKDREKEE